jgi:hypothetical protein
MAVNFYAQMGLCCTRVFDLVFGLHDFFKISSSGNAFKKKLSSTNNHQKNQCNQCGYIAHNKRGIRQK